MEYYVVLPWASFKTPFTGYPRVVNAHLALLFRAMCFGVSVLASETNTVSLAFLPLVNHYLLCVTFLLSALLFFVFSNFVSWF